jgi:hypothetical protein
MIRFLYVSNFLEMVTGNNIWKVVSQIALHESNMNLFSDCATFFFLTLSIKAGCTWFIIIALDFLWVPNSVNYFVLLILAKTMTFNR